MAYLVGYFEALFGCHEILILGRSPIKWRQRRDMSIAVDWDVKHQFKQSINCFNKVKTEGPGIDTIKF